MHIPPPKRNAIRGKVRPIGHNFFTAGELRSFLLLLKVPFVSASRNLPKASFEAFRRNETVSDHRESGHLNPANSAVLSSWSFRSLFARRRHATVHECAG
eukprot:s102_g25.t1